MGAYQFKQTDRFIPDHTDYTISVYDDEQKASPKCFKATLVEFMERVNYTCDIVTFDELTDFINDLQWSQDQSFR